MGIVVGVDVGGSRTKIVGLCDYLELKPLTVTAADPIASIFGALGKFIDSNNLDLTDIDRIMVTGVGSSFISKPIYGIKTGIVREFLANGLGGLYLSELESAIIVSMGTGTALVSATGSKIEHIGGTGIGGGTILGLCNKLINVRNIEIILELAESGNLDNVDLMVCDLTKSPLPGLPPDITASNFGKTSDIASKNDIAMGVLNLVFQSVGTAAFFALKGSGMSHIVLIGSLSSMSICDRVFKRLTALYGANFVIPKNSEFATAYGAALAYIKDNDFEELNK